MYSKRELFKNELYLYYRKNNNRIKIFSIMKNLIIIILSFLLGFAIVINQYLRAEYQRNTQYKLRIMELQEKRNNTASMALETIYNDSINNTVKCWLSDDTSK